MGAPVQRFPCFAKFSRSIPAVVLLTGLGLGLGAAKRSFAQPESRPAGLAPGIVFVEAPSVVPGALTGRFPRGSHLEFLSPAAPARPAVDLTPEFFAAADPQVSFDATHVIFSGQKTRGVRWQIWEMSVDGSGMKQITHCAGNCLRPAFLPRNQIVFTMVTGKGSRLTSAIYVSQANGADAHPITFGPGNFQVETVLHSGRILVSARSALVDGAKDGDSRLFYTLRTDGSGLTPFRSKGRPHVVRTGAEELRDGTLLFVARQDRRSRQAGGELAWIRPGALHHTAITPPDSVYWSAHLLDGDRLVVSKRSGGSSGAAGKFGLYVFDLASKTLGKAIYRNPKDSSVGAVPVEPRPAPLEYFSILHPKRDYGRMICLNSSLSQDAPGGRLKTRIAHVRVIALQNRRQRVLGEAPVESDGSFYIKVPADRPIRFELLNSQGKVIHAQRSWIWARNGEDVGCLGCHENRALTPANHWPLALRSPGAPFPVGVPSHSHPGRH